MDRIRIGGSPGTSLAGLAKQEAINDCSDRIQTHHILLALLGVFPSDACRVLSLHGVTRDKVQAAVKQIVEHGGCEERHPLTDQRLASCERTGTPPPTRQAENAFLAGIEEAELLGHHAATWCTHFWVS